MPKKKTKRFGGRDITPGTIDQGSGSDSDMARLYGGNGDPEPMAMYKQRMKREMVKRVQGLYSPNRVRR